MVYDQDYKIEYFLKFSINISGFRDIPMLPLLKIYTTCHLRCLFLQGMKTYH